MTPERSRPDQHTAPTERLRLLPVEQLDPDQRALYEAIVEGPRQLARTEHLEGPFNGMLHHPPIGAPLQRLGAAIRYEGSLADRARELATLVVAVHLRCDFEWHVHGANARALGVDEEQLAALQRRAVPPRLSEAEATIIEATSAMLETCDLPDQLYARVEELVGYAGLVELSSLVGYYSLLALQLRLFRVAVPQGVSPVFVDQA